MKEDHVSKNKRAHANEQRTTADTDDRRPRNYSSTSSYDRYTSNSTYKRSEKSSNNSSKNYYERK